MTTYLIFRRVNTTSWDRVGQQEASSPKQALRKHHAEHELAESGAYAAVPELNWTELSYEIVTEARLVFR